MVELNFAYTGPVNPQGASPVLTIPQLWQGLQRKVRFAYEFVPVIEKCKVIKEEGNTIRREIYFASGGEAGSVGKTVQETCRLFEPNKVDFVRDDGGVVQNIVSDDPSGGDDIHMTYAFHLPMPDLTDPAEAEKTLAQQKKMAKMAVESTLVAIREMVKSGKI